MQYLIESVLLFMDYYYIHLKCSDPCRGFENFDVLGTA